MRQPTGIAQQAVQQKGRRQYTGYFHPFTSYTRFGVYISLGKVQIDDENFIAFRIVSLYA